MVGEKEGRGEVSERVRSFASIGRSFGARGGLGEGGVLAAAAAFLLSCFWGMEFWGGTWFVRVRYPFFYLPSFISGLGSDGYRRCSGLGSSFNGF